MRGLVNHEKRNLLAITLVYTIVICFILQYVIATIIYYIVEKRKKRRAV